MQELVNFGLGHYVELDEHFNKETNGALKTGHKATSQPLSVQKQYKNLNSNQPLFSGLNSGNLNLSQTQDIKQNLNFLA